MSRIRFVALPDLTGPREYHFRGGRHFGHRQKDLGARKTFVAKCEVCENEYDKSFEVVAGGKRHTFDSFECAIHALAPVCPHCQCRIIGHGVEQEGKIFCCVNCARSGGKTELKDRV
jgi:hypothetical protein